MHLIFNNIALLIIKTREGKRLIGILESLKIISKNIASSPPN